MNDKKKKKRKKKKNKRKRKKTGRGVMGYRLLWSVMELAEGL
jgi:hypothetical protein